MRRLTISGCTALVETRLESASLKVLVCHGVQREVYEGAADRTRCPNLLKIICEGYEPYERGFVEVD